MKEVVTKTLISCFVLNYLLVSLSRTTNDQVSLFV